MEASTSSTCRLLLCPTTTHSISQRFVQRILLARHWLWVTNVQIVQVYCADVEVKSITYSLIKVVCQNNLVFLNDLCQIANLPKLFVMVKRRYNESVNIFEFLWMKYSTYWCTNTFTNQHTTDKYLKCPKHLLNFSYLTVWESSNHHIQKFAKLFGKNSIEWS